jgi:hypothetical protein
MRILAILAAVFLSSEFVYAQEPKPPAKRAAPTLPSPAETVRRAEADFAASSGGCDLKDPAAAKACNEALVANYLYLASAYRHRRDSFSWNLAASQIMFSLVVLIVISGLLFATVQFWMAMRRTRNPGPGSDKSGLDTDLEISGKGIKVSSSVLGIIILVISMAFFYMYALYIYPIHEVRHNAGDVVQGTPK